MEVATRPAAVILLFALNQGDVLTTRWVLGLGGRETNPIAAQLLTHSMHTIELVKLGLIAAIALAVVLSPARQALRSARWIWSAVIVYSLVVIWNCAQRQIR